MRWRKRLRQVIALVGAVLWLLLLWPIRCHRHSISAPFAGETWYNPFAADSLIWSRANFHVHSRTWGGLTNGKNTPSVIDSAYAALGYAYVGIADYQSVNPASQIPLYEHGWGLRKFHQLVFAPEQIVWWDVPWPFTRDLYQSILNRLAGTARLIAIAHPVFRPYHTCPGDVLRDLGGYEAIEVLNRYGDSIAEWDSVLSHGHYAAILGSDNVHDVHDPHQITSRWTEIALPPQAPLESLLEAIRTGKTVGYKNKVFTPILPDTYPRFARISVEGDTLLVITDRPIDSLRIVGQEGRAKAVSRGGQMMSYLIQPEDTYLRIEAYAEAVEAYASPLVKGGPTRHPLPSVSVWQTALWRISLLLSTGMWIWLLWPRKRNLSPKPLP